jgi:drug/metabolite transporter (DMT)-like permease
MKSARTAKGSAEMSIESQKPGPIRLFLLLAVGSVAVSFASIFVRLAGAPALAVAAYRVTWATLIVAPFSLAGPARELRSLSGSQWRSLAAAGVALALHFALWIASLSFTSVASSVLLVDTAPFFIGVTSQWLLDRPLPRPFWGGLAVSFVGCAIILGGDWGLSSGSLKGNLLALGGAVAMAVYLLAGAELRPRLSLLAYVFPVYGTAAAALTLTCLATGVPLAGYSLRACIFMFLLGLVPQCIGHTSYNWSLRYLRPALVGLVTLAEPVGATALAYLILGEGLTWHKAVGGGIILGGIYLATRQDAVGGK